MGRLIAIALVLASVEARADDRFRLRVAAAGGIVASSDQWRHLHLDQPIAEGQARLAWMPIEELALEAAFSGGAFFSSQGAAGGLIDVALGLEAGVRTGSVRPWLSAHLGAGVTGTIPVPVLRIAIGIDGALSDEVGLGPFFAFGNAFYEDAPNRTSDAQFLTLGLSVTYSPVPSRDPPRVPRRPVRHASPTLPIPPPLPDETILALIDEAAGLEPRELLVPVLFDFDSADIVTCSAASLHALREYLAEHDEIRALEIEGHADSSGDDAYNDELARLRAEAIFEWLVTRGVDPERLRVASRGERRRVEENATEPERQQNRRARFRIVEEGSR